jgi:glycosyltransferase involved in cell wall biosynthesis
MGEMRRDEGGAFRNDIEPSWSRETNVRIALLTEGDAETRDSWSGSALSVVEALRGRGHEVACGDVDLAGFDRVRAALQSFSPDRARWGVKYHLGAPAFALRSRRADRHLREHAGAIDVALQIGATCRPRPIPGVPLVLYCDSNILLASHAQAVDSAVSDFHHLSPGEVKQIEQRETGVYRQASAILTMSERLRRSFIEDFGLPAEKVHTIHAGPNFDPDRIPVRGMQRPDGPPTVLFVGRAFERKGGDVILAAFARVRAELPAARLLIVGPSDLRLDQPGVTCLGFLDKQTPAGWQALCDAYASADVFCLPTRFEPFGIAFLEAMFFGVPCVGPDEWAVPEMIRDGVTGHLATPGDERAFADRLVTLLRDPGAAARMGTEGRRLARESFTWPASIDRMLMVFENLRRR